MVGVHPTPSPGSLVATRGCALHRTPFDGKGDQIWGEPLAHLEGWTRNSYADSTDLDVEVCVTDLHIYTTEMKLAMMVRTNGHDVCRTKDTSFHSRDRHNMVSFDIGLTIWL